MNLQILHKHAVQYNSSYRHINIVLFVTSVGAMLISGRSVRDIFCLINCTTVSCDSWELAMLSRFISFFNRSRYLVYSSLFLVFSKNFLLKPNKNPIKNIYKRYPKISYPITLCCQFLSQGLKTHKRHRQKDQSL